MAGKSNGRMDRINEEVRRELSEILREEVKDPRLDNCLLSVLKADTTKDLKYCKVYISVLNSKQPKEDIEKALKSAAGFIRRELAYRLNLRNTPELKFIMDDSIEYSIHISKVLQEYNVPEGNEEAEEE
jgi:ribosome-binding factor A